MIQVSHAAQRVLPTYVKWISAVALELIPKVRRVRRDLMLIVEMGWNVYGVPHLMEHWFVAIQSLLSEPFVLAFFLKKRGILPLY